MLSREEEVLNECNLLIYQGNLTRLSEVIDETGCLKYKLHKLSLLHLAAWHNQPHICQFLVEKGLSPDIRETFSQKTPLHLAAYRGNLEAAEALINSGARYSKSKHTRDSLCCLPIHYAALGENQEMIFLFLKLGHLIGPQDLSSKGFDSSTVSLLGNVIDILIRKGNAELLDLFSSAQGISAVETNPNVRSTVYVGYRNEYPWTPMHSAAVMGKVAPVEMLLKKFPHAFCLSETFQHLFSYSPGEVAVLEGHQKVAKLFGEQRERIECLKDYCSFSVRKDAPTYMQALLEAFLERDFGTVGEQLERYGHHILSINAFDSHDSRYVELDKLNFFSVASRCLSISFFTFLKKTGVSIPEEEFRERDTKEMVFFNWANMDINPYAAGFFNQLEGLLAIPKPV